MATKFDPRTDKCKKFALSGGKVTGVALTVHAMPETKWQLVKVDLYDENDSRNETKCLTHVIERIKVGTKTIEAPARAKCFLAWPIDSSGDPDSLEQWQLPGNVNQPYEHIITNTFSPPKKGPLAIFIGDDDGNIDSDVVGGLGLPDGRHVSYHLVFVQR